MNLILSNFQIHQKPTTLEIPEGETTYVEGDSDIGKSSRLRAMRWAGENKPDGGSFVTFKQPRGTNARVMLELDGRVIIRERGKSTNLYKMDGETFEAFGRSVPEPIAKFLALSPYAFQLQGEPPFLIGASPTDAAKILSDACGLGVIDTATAFVKGKKTVADAEIRKSEILLESAQSRLAQATEQLPLADALEKAAGLGEEVLSLTDRYGWIAHVIDDEPAGDLLDVDAVRSAAATARACEAERGMLTTMVMRLCGAIRGEPTGEPLDVAGVRPVLERGLAVVPEQAALCDRRARLLRAIEGQPVGSPTDVSTAKMIAGQANVIGGWLKDVSNGAERIRFVLRNEPMGEVRDMSAVKAAAVRANAVHYETDLLDNMRRDMRYALETEPRGELMDTSELTKQRAQIRVCTTCQRELP